MVDEDVDKDTGEATGRATLDSLNAARHPHFAETPSGGRHHFYRWSADCPRNSTKKSNGLPGVDIRSEGGYVVAWAPERLIAAHAADLPGPPAAVLAAIADAKAKKGGDSKPVSTEGLRIDTGGGPWAETAVEREISELRATGAGGRNHALNKAAFSLGQIVGGGLLSREHVEAELTAAGLAIGLGQSEIAKTVASGLDAGEKEPRAPSDKTDKSPQRTSSVGSGGFVGDNSASVWPAADMTILRADRGTAPALPLADVFGPAWARWIAEAADAKGAPADYVAAGVLTVAGSLIGNSRWVSPWAGWAEPPTVWAALIGSPSAGKSPALDAALAPLRSLERRLRRDAEKELAAWVDNDEAAQLALAAWKAEATKALKGGGDPPAKPAAADPGPEPHVPRLVVNDATVERHAVILARQPRGTLAMRDELSGWLANMSRYAGGGSDKPFWLEAYGGRPFTVERMSRAPVCVERLTVAALGGIQPDRLSSLLIKADDDGMLARLLPIWPEPAPIKRPTSAPDEAFAESAFTRLYGLGMPTTEEGEPRPWVIHFTEPARTILDDFRKWAREVEAGEAGLMQSLIGKFPGMAARLSLILAHLDWAASSDALPPPEVTADHFGRAACYIAEYALPMAKRAYAEASAPVEERAAQRLAHLVIDEKWEAFTLRDVTRRERQGLRRNAEVEPALDVLTQAGWLRCDRQAPGPKGGRPQLIFRVNPAIWRAA